MPNYRCSEMETYPRCYFSAKKLCFIKRISPESMEYIFLLSEYKDRRGYTFRPYQFLKRKTEGQNIDEFVKDARPISLEEYKATKLNLFEDAEN